MKITKAKFDDLDVIMELFKAATREMDSKGIPQWDEVYPNEAIIKEDILKQQMYIGCVDNKIASVFVLNKEYDEAYKVGNWEYKNASFMVIHRLCIHPDYQNQGMGTRTMQCIEALVKEEKIESIRLDAFSLNPFALKLYKKLGYKEVGEVNWRKGMFYLFEKKI